MGIWIPNVWILNFLKLRIQMYSNGRYMCFVLITRLTIWIMDQHIRKQDGSHLSGIKMVGLSGVKMVGLSSIQMAFKYWTIWYPTYFWPFEYLTSLVFRSPMYSWYFGLTNLNNSPIAGKIFDSVLKLQFFFVCWSGEKRANKHPIMKVNFTSYIKNCINEKLN